MSVDGRGCEEPTHCAGCICSPAKMDPVEQKIKEIIHEFKWSATPVSRKYDALRELVELVRGTK